MRVLFIAFLFTDLHHSPPEVTMEEVESQSSVPPQATVTVDISNAFNNQDATVLEEIKEPQKQLVL